MPTDLAVMDAGDDSGGQPGTLATTTPSGQPTPSSEPSWLGEITSRILQSDTMQRLQAVARSQIAAAVTGAAWALNRLPEGQRQLLAEDVVRDLKHVQAICEKIIKTLSKKHSREELASALDDMGYVAERLAAYYEKYIGLLGAAAPRHAISAMSTAERGTLHRMAQEVGSAEIAQHINERVQSTSASIRDIIKLLHGRDDQEQSNQGQDADQADKQTIGADEMTYALGRLAALAESANQALRGIYTRLQKQPHTMPGKATSTVRHAITRLVKKQPKKQKEKQK